MTHTVRTLTLAHTMALAWLVYCGAVSADHHAPGYAALFYVAAASQGLAVVREYAHAHQKRVEAVLAEAAARPTLPPATEDVLAVAIHGLESACCDGWLATLGADHDPTCPTQQQPTA